jgi:hypothetical protein
MAITIARLILKNKFLWMPLLVPIPVLFVWPTLFLRLEAMALLIPVTLFLHEWLHVMLASSSCGQTAIVCDSIRIAVRLDRSIPPGRALLAALLPPLVISVSGILITLFDTLLGLPFLLHVFSIPCDLYGWLAGVMHESA